MFVEISWKDLGIDKDGVCLVNDERERKARPYKGKTIFTSLSDYTVVDLETTGLCPMIDEIIEIGAVRIREHKEVASFHLLIKPQKEIPSFIEKLTGITNEMVKEELEFIEVIPEFLKFLGDDIVVGHNVHFDINFLYDQCEEIDIPFINCCMDTMRLSKFLFKGFENYKLKTLIKTFGIGKSVEHRAISDALQTFQCYEYMLNYAVENGIVIEPKKSIGNGLNAKDIVAIEGKADTQNPLYNQMCVFTGTLDRMTRKQAMQLVVNIGGKITDNVTKQVDYLVLGNTDYRKVKEGKSSKLRKAEQLKLEGYDIEIIPEDEFYEMFSKERNTDVS